MTDKPIFVGVGEVLWDCFEDGRRPGGAPANQAFHATQLGARGMVVSRIGRDELGAELRAFLAAQGLDLGLLQEDAEHATGTVEVRRTSSGEPRYHITSNVAWDHLEATPPLLAAMAQADVVCFGTLAQRREPSGSTIVACLEHAPQALKVFDLNLRQSYYTPDRVRTGLRHADVLKLNDHEAAVLPALLEAPPKNPREVALWCIEEFGLRLVCVTRGAEGCWLFGDGEEVEVPGVPVQQADPVGAGDAFTAALVTTYRDRPDLERAGRFANEVGALVASHSGAMVPLAEPLAELRARLW